MSILIKKGLIEGKEKDLLIQAGKIAQIADNIDVETEYKIDGKNKAILPGMVNAHTHSAMTLLRGYADDMPLQRWLQTKIWPAEKKLTEEAIYWGTKLGILEMIKTGTTMFNDMYWHPEAIMKAAKDTGIRAAVSLVFIDFKDPSIINF